MIDLRELRARAKYIKETRHPEFPLIIWNYTPECQYDKAWDEYTVQCRGLITTETGEIVARPFKKFFNINERPDTTITALPAVRPEISEKLDGSLGISYFYQGVPYIATRGSFKSEQSEWANSNKSRLLNLDMLRREYTYLFELIYPSNRIVVDYGQQESFVLLACIHTSTGKELTSAELLGEAERIGTVAAKTYDGTITEALEKLKTLDGTKGEGFVLRYPDGLRVKAKSEDYKRLHYLFTETSSVSIWECLSKGTQVNLDELPDELYAWVERQTNTLRYGYTFYNDLAHEAYNEAKKLPTRKEQAKYIAEYDVHGHNLTGLVFALLDNKDISSLIWKRLKPKYERPSTCQE